MTYILGFGEGRALSKSLVTKWVFGLEIRATRRFVFREFDPNAQKHLRMALPFGRHNLWLGI